MAMSKSDYIQLGINRYESGADRPIGGSWQQNAIIEGWDSARASASAIIDSPFVTPKNIETISVNIEAPNYTFYKQTAIESHIDCLTAEFLSEPANSKRYHRLAAKIAKLRYRHFS